MTNAPSDLTPFAAAPLTSRSSAPPAGVTVASAASVVTATDFGPCISMASVPPERVMSFLSV